MLSFNGVAVAVTLTKLSACAIALLCTVNKTITALRKERILFKIYDFNYRKMNKCSFVLIEFNYWIATSNGTLVGGKHLSSLHTMYSISPETLVLTAALNVIVLTN